MRPLALDLFCKAGGAGMGLHQAGFDVIGVDIEFQKSYPFNFVQADALRPPFDLSRFDFIWASPPCQDYSALRGLATEKRPRLIPDIRGMLTASGKPWAIENVVGAELYDPITLCGSMFGLGVWRHRLFEMSHRPILVPQCNHSLCPKPVDVTGSGGPFTGIRCGGGVSRKPKDLAHARYVMGIDWMNRGELSEAIPPAFAEYIGREALLALTSHDSTPTGNTGE